MNDAIKAHVEWLIGLADLTDDQTLRDADPQRVRSIDLCKIGQWLRGLETDFGYLAEFVLAHTRHADFHHQAGDILELCQAGNREQAHHRLGLLSGLDGASQKLVEALAALLDKLHLMGVESYRLLNGLSCDPVFKFE